MTLAACLTACGQAPIRSDHTAAPGISLQMCGAVKVKTKGSIQEHIATGPDGVCELLVARRDEAAAIVQVLQVGLFGSIHSRTLQDTRGRASGRPTRELIIEYPDHPAVHVIHVRQLLVGDRSLTLTMSFARDSRLDASGRAATARRFFDSLSVTSDR